MANFENWDSDELKEATTRYTKWYKCKLGYVDTIRIMDKPYGVFRHNWNDSKGKFMSSMCSMEEHGSCPFCDKLPAESRQPAFATTVLHILRRPNQAGTKPKFVGQILAWRFGNDKKTDLVEINEVTGKRLRSVDLQVKIKGTSPEDEQFQKLQIIKLDKPVMDRLGKDILKRIKASWEKEQEAVRRLYLPTPEDLKARMKDDEEAVEFDPEKLEDQEGESDLPFEVDEEEDTEERGTPRKGSPGKPQKGKKGKPGKPQKGKKGKKDAFDLDDEIEELTE